MKSIVVYYSQSGNTKKIAQAIQNGMSQTADESRIARLSDIGPGELAGYDLIGLGSPIINGREPPNVTGFIDYSLKPVDGKHGFAFSTHGALPANFLARVVPAMAQRGLTMVGWNDWFGSVVYPAIPKPYFTDGHPDEIDLKEAENFGREMVERSRAIYAGDSRLIPSFPRGKEYDEIYNPLSYPNDPEGLPKDAGKKFHKFMATMAFRVNKEKCKYPKCTHCMDNCPMDAIDLSASPPVFGYACMQCFQCEQTCPQGAIETDMAEFQRGHDQFVTSALAKFLEIFEARGHFRRLVPLDKVGWDTPFWTFKKPRFKIDR
jgi:NAD-dependent dihydropyrimidine dehydrogenase PreA subunit